MKTKVAKISLEAWKQINRKQGEMKSEGNWRATLAEALDELLKGD